MGVSVGTLRDRSTALGCLPGQRLNGKSRSLALPVLRAAELARGWGWPGHGEGGRGLTGLVGLAEGVLASAHAPVGAVVLLAEWCAGNAVCLRDKRGWSPGQGAMAHPWVLRPIHGCQGPSLGVTVHPWVSQSLHGCCVPSMGARSHP